MNKWFIFFCFVSQIIFGQNFNISGKIIDKSNGEVLIGSNVYCTKSKQGSTSNNYGFYSLNLPSGTRNIICSYIGYQSDSLKINLISDTIIDFEIIPKKNDLSEVFLQVKKNTIKSVLSEISIPIKDIQKLPALLGEKDVLKSIQLLPGVQSGNEGTSGLYVRGGGGDQNLILLDGVTVYNASHLFGFVSIFNDNAIKKIKLYKGGFPARFGGRMSSVLDINMRDGNLKNWQVEGGLGLISGDITIQGPVVKDKTSIIISARRTWIDILAKPLTKLIQRNSQVDNNGGLDGTYYFYDFNTKLNHKLSNNDRIIFSFYSGKDDFSNNYNNSSEYIYDETDDSNYSSTINTNSGFGLSWANTTSTLRWSHIINNKIFSNTTLLYSRYVFNNLISNNNELINIYSDLSQTISNENSDYLYKSGIEDIGVRLDFDYAISKNHYFKFGVSYIKHIFFPGEMEFTSESEEFSYTSNAIFSEHLKPNDFSIYFEDLFTITNRFTANLGIHQSLFSIDKKIYQATQPRLSLRYLLNEKSSVKLSYAIMQQHIHLLTNSSYGLPNDMWVPTTEFVPPSSSEQIVCSYHKSFNNNIYEASIEIYHKSMKNLITFSEGSNVIATNFSSWADRIEMNGTGKSNGLELFLKKNNGKFTGWLGYTLSKTTRQFDNINLGREYSYKFDRTHDISIVCNYQMNNQINFSATWIYGTGNTMTMPIAQYLLIDGDQINEFFEYGSKNDFRMPAYHRLDISCNLIKQKNGKTSSWTIGIYNIYNRNNPFFITLDDEIVDGVRRKVAKQISLFPIIPSLKYNFKF